MASISGSQTDIGIKIAPTWGTAVACGVGNRFSAELTPNFNISELTARTIGSGAYMLSDVTRGNLIPTIAAVGDLGYRNNWDVVFAQFLGTAAVPTETTPSQADYKHLLRFNSILNAKFLTLAFADTSTTTLEFPTCATRTIGLKSTTVPGYVEASAEFLAGMVNLSSATNTNATLAATTFTDGELVACDFTDYYRHNAQSGAGLSSGDNYAITSFDFSLTRPQDCIPEIKGSAGNSAPSSSGYMDGTLTISVKDLVDHAMYTVWSAETAYKLLLDIEGTQIGTGTNKTYQINIPRAKLVTEPTRAVTDPGTNALTLTWRLLYTATAPTGMTGMNYPSLNITNGLATSLLA